MSHAAEYIWRYGGIDVLYSPEVDGGGSSSAPQFIAAIKDYFGPETHFGTVFEWCAGAGFLGFGLLAEDICDCVCLADIHPPAIDCANRTIRANSLERRARCYVSDNLSSVPQDERFDLVVGNPPSWYAPNPAHPANAADTTFDVRGDDPGWRVHSVFYSQILPFLNPGAFVVIQEVEPRSHKVFLGPHAMPVDIRPEDQATLFTDMIQRGGLVHVADRELRTPWWPQIKSSLQISQRRA